MTTVHYRASKIIKKYYSLPGDKEINLFQCSFAFHKETSHLICCANQMAGLYIRITHWTKMGNSFPFHRADPSKEKNFQAL